jgi:hypothetical protein
MAIFIPISWSLMAGPRVDSLTDIVVVGGGVDVTVTVAIAVTAVPLTGVTVRV